MELSLLAVILGFILDFIVGDPHWLYHPIRLVGHLISGLEKLLRSIFPKTEQGELIAGGFLLVLTAGITTAVAWGLLLAAGLVHPYLRFALEVIMCYWVLATKSLKTETMKVYDALKEGDLKKARFAVSMVVGRDTEVLDDIGVTKAAVETVAENASDGVIAPLLFLMIGGAPLGFFDNVLNYIPARLSGMLMCGAAAFCGMDSKNAWRIYWRDRYNHSSPNSAHTEATAAGAMHIQLAGNAYYFGKLYEKPTLGDPDRPVEYEDIPRVNRLLYATAILSLVVFGLVKGIALWLI